MDIQYEKIVEKGNFILVCGMTGSGKTTLLKKLKEYFKDNDINQWQKGYPDINTILDDILSGNSFVLSEHSHIYGTMHFIIGIEPSYVRIYNGHWLTDTRQYGIIHRFAIDNNHKGNG